MSRDRYDDDRYRPRMQRSPYERIDEQSRGGKRKIRALIGVVLTILALAAVIFGAMLLADTYALLPAEISDILNTAEDATANVVATGKSAVESAIGKSISATTSLIFLVCGTVAAILGLLFASSAVKSSSSTISGLSKLMKLLGMLAVIVGLLCIAALVALPILAENGIVIPFLS